MNCIIVGDKYEKGTKSKGWNGSFQITKKYSLLEYQIKNLKKIFPKCKICYIYGFDAKRFEQFIADKQIDNITTIYNEDYNENGEVFSLSKAGDFFDSGCLFIGGNRIIRPKTFENFSNNKSQIFVNHKNQNHIGCSLDDSGKVIQIFFDLEYYWCDTFFITKKDIELFSDLVLKHEHRNYFSFEILNKMIDLGKKITAYDLNNKKLLETI